MAAQDKIQKPNVSKILWNPTREMQNVRQNPLIATPLIMLRFFLY